MLSMTFDLNSYVPFLLNRAGSRIAGAFASTLKQHDLNITTWRLMAALYQREQLRIGELAAYTSIELWTVSRVINKLEGAGMVVRQRVDDDARSVSVTLTARGVERVEELIPHAMQYEAIPLDGFTEEETRQLQQMLHRLYRNMDRLGAAHDE